jgi:carbamoyltransferase
MSDFILGISAYYHDSAAALLKDGKIIAAAHEERFTRKKHDAGFPTHAARYVLEEGGIAYQDLQAVAFYDKPFLKFERLLETYHAFAPQGLTSFLSAIPLWIKEKVFTKRLLREELTKLGDGKVSLLFPEHHLSHAASAFYPSPFAEAAILTVDGVGEWATTTIGKGEGNTITILKEMHFPHSLGLLYSAFTYYTGFRVNSGEYKLMGLAPYGNPNAGQTKEIREKIGKELIDIREDGSLLLNMDYFRFATGLRMTDDKKWQKLFGFPPKEPESEPTQAYMNMALAIQQVTEEIMLKLARTAKEMTGLENLVMAGGVALNSVANGKILKKELFKDVWIQPAAGDAGGALGAAYAAWYIWKGEKRNTDKLRDAMQGAFLGPSFEDKEIRKVLNRYNVSASCYNDFDQLCTEVAVMLAAGKVVGWFQGRMEFGPRALGNRSILGDARNPQMQKNLNLKIKHREGFRPFAPSVLEEDIGDYFELDRPSPYMLLVVPIRAERKKTLPEGYDDLPLYDRLYYPRSDLPVITHIDYSARIQSVSRKDNPRYWQLINAFKDLTGYGVIVNTSFNVRGEPIVCTPEDAYKCFIRTEMDYLVLGNYLIAKEDMTSVSAELKKEQTFELD